MSDSIWQQCLEKLREEFPPTQIKTWINPLQAEESQGALLLLAPNHFVVKWVEEHFLERIRALLKQISGQENLEVRLDVGDNRPPVNVVVTTAATPSVVSSIVSPVNRRANNLNPKLTFDTFVQGKCNEIPHAACLQVANNPGEAYNPLFIYGGVGLGKTHLMHAIGNKIIQNSGVAKVLYLHSERFVADMVKALQTNTINDFKRFYRSLNLLMIDDIQFFAGKDRSQEEFFSHL